MHDLWRVDTGNYKRAYCEALQRAQSDLPPHILSKISVPQAIALPAVFEQQRIRLLVMGQETRGNHLGLIGCDCYETWSRQIGGYVAFDYADGGDASQRNGKFWKAVDEIREVFALPSKRAMAWSNVLKVQLIEETKNSYSLSRLPSEAQMQVLRWQRKLFEAELAFIRPSAIIFLTGSLHWVADQMFDSHQRLTKGSFDIVRIENLEIPMVQTHHPNARNGASVNRARADALGYLKAQLVN